MWAVEIKIEQAWTGNLFLETWSKRNLEDKASHAELGSAPGWLLKTRADLLLYYFLDTDDLVTLPVFRLKQWAFGSGEEGQDATDESVWVTPDRTARPSAYPG